MPSPNKVSRSLSDGQDRPVLRCLAIPTAHVRVDSPAGPSSTHHTGVSPQVAVHQPPRPSKGHKSSPGDLGIASPSAANNSPQCTGQRGLHLKMPPRGATMEGMRTSCLFKARGPLNLDRSLPPPPGAAPLEASLGRLPAPLLLPGRVCPPGPAPGQAQSPAGPGAAEPA